MTMVEGEEHRKVNRDTEVHGKTRYLGNCLHATAVRDLFDLDLVSHSISEANAFVAGLQIDCL